MRQRKEFGAADGSHRSVQGPRRFFAVAAAVLGLALLSGIVPRIARRERLAAEVHRVSEERPLVRVVQPMHAAGSGQLVLPGSVEAIFDVPLYARTNGYLRRRLVDIGDVAQAGQLLAEIDTPELDQEIAQAQAGLAQARASLSQAKATLDFAKANAARYDQLAGAEYASVQEAEEKRSAAAVAVANVEAAEAAISSSQANLARLRELKGFSRVAAPFAGTITQRSTEIGSLITAGQGDPLFRLARTDTVRVFVHVPQVNAPQIAVGQTASIEVRGWPGRSFKGEVTRTTHAIDLATRTMLTEIQTANPDGALLPGMYGQVSLSAGGGEGELLIPASALVFSAQGTQVLTVDDHECIRVQAVRIAADYGTQIAIGDGLEGEERVVANPGERMIEGTQVRVQTKTSSAPAGVAAQNRP
jgi:membrane fusion protein (multidrug efflux system)